MKQQKPHDTTLVAAQRAADLLWLQAQEEELIALSIARCEAAFSWLTKMPAKRRDTISLVAGNGIKAFINSYAMPEKQQQLDSDIFGAAPRELSQSVTLQQTLQLIQMVVAVVEEVVSARNTHLHEAVLRFSRDVAFTAAAVYAKAAERRGLWDARLESLIVDAIVSDKTESDQTSRLAALGWKGNGAVTLLVGTISPDADVENLRRTVRKHNCDVLIGMQGSRMLLVLGLFAQKENLQIATAELTTLANALQQHFLDAPLVIGQTVHSISQAHRSARAALNALKVADSCYGVTYPAAADDLLPERIIAGDMLARKIAMERIYVPLKDAANGLLVTLQAYLATGGSLEHASRELFVHTNTVRYRLKRVQELLQLDPTNPRDAFVLRTALTAGELLHKQHTAREQ